MVYKVDLHISLCAILNLKEGERKGREEKGQCVFFWEPLNQKATGNGLPCFAGPAEHYAQVSESQVPQAPGVSPSLSPLPLSTPGHTPAPKITGVHSHKFSFFHKALIKHVKRPKTFPRNPAAKNVCAEY